ncbi:hypothetical protein HK101_004604, partial [Irineochytrium annulatum]
MPVRAISHLSLSAPTDERLDAAVSFYVDRLGFSLVEDKDHAKWLHLFPERQPGPDAGEGGITLRIAIDRTDAFDAGEWAKKRREDADRIAEGRPWACFSVEDLK